jgi:tRNA A-37 threonylcarbamoyl transferase component Bud32/tetratricopeptide (TPR) repeat protein
MNARVEKLFHQLADLSPEERARYLAEHDIDEETRREAEQLLAFDSHDSAPLVRDIGFAADRTLTQLDAMGRRCGPYRLVSVIGRGGMGVVYLAERVDGEVTQRAAVKLLQPGLQDIQRERFLQEREILAGLTHPNIAHLLDAGHLEDGQPFLVMEYVEGKAIDVSTAGLDIRQKISLFLKVCAAVGYLHRNLVVHRDLKPSNIVVTEDGEPKLLDFGIAKMLELKTDSTTTGMRMLTPDYASPEQLMGGRVSTTSDIYSLGAVLYQLLTGKSPHAFDDGSPAAIAFAISTREVTRPSKWAPRLKGDLELILLKALRKEPQERYATVEQFAEDLEAFLDSRPIRARSGDAWYRTRKFLRRYRLPVSAAVLATASLCVGLWVANRERAVAQQRFVQVRQLAGHLIFDLHDEIRNVPGATQARDKLALVATEYLDALAQDAHTDAELAWELMNAYYRLSQTRGGVGANLGRTEEAYRLSQKVVKMADSFQARGQLDSQRAETLFNIYDQLTTMYVDMRRKAAAGEVVQKLLRLIPEISPFQKAQALRSASGYEERFGSPTRALGHAEASTRILESLPRQQAVRYQHALNLIQLARVQARLGLFDKAVESYSASTTILEPVLRSDPRDQKARRLLYFGHVGVADLLASDDRFNLGRVDEAERHFRGAIDLAEQMAASDTKNEAARVDLARATGKLGSAIYGSRPAEALALMNRAYNLMIKTSPANDAAAELKCSYFNESVKPLIRLGRVAEAQSNVDAAFALLQELRSRNPKRDWTDWQLGIHATQSLVYETRRNWRAALETANRELDLIELRGEPAVLGEDYERVETLERIIRFAIHTDRSVAINAQKRLVDIWTRWRRELPDSKYVAGRLHAAVARLNTL